MSSSMLEQAIIDAEALKEAAIKNAEATVVEKYSADIKKAVEQLLEQAPAEDPAAAMAAMMGGAPPEGAMGMPPEGAAPPGGENLASQLDPSYVGEQARTVNVNLGALLDEMKMDEELDPDDLALHELVAEEVTGEGEASTRETEETVVIQESLLDSILGEQIEEPPPLPTGDRGGYPPQPPVGAMPGAPTPITREFLEEDEDLYEGNDEDLDLYEEDEQNYTPDYERHSRPTGVVPDTERVGLLNPDANYTPGVGEYINIGGDPQYASDDPFAVPTRPGYDEPIERSYPEQSHLPMEQGEQMRREAEDRRNWYTKARLGLGPAAYDDPHGYRIEESFQKELASYQHNYAKLYEAYQAYGQEYDNLYAHHEQLTEQNNKFREVLVESQNRLNEVNLRNAQLHYTNRILTSDSLNERQKNKIVEAVSKSGTVEEAKTIFETLQSAVAGTSNNKQAPKSLNEVINKRSSAFLPRRKEETQSDSNYMDRLQRLAGIKQ